MTTLSFIRHELSAIFLVLFTAILFGLNIGFTIYWTHMQVTHECQALEILTGIPVSPKQAQTYKFHNALLSWQDADGCR